MDSKEDIKERESQTRESVIIVGARVTKHATAPTPRTQDTASEVGNDEGGELIWGACVIDEVQDVNPAE